MNHLAEEELLEVFYNEGDSGSRDHIHCCAECRRRFERLSEDLASLPVIQVPERGEKYGQHVWNRLDLSRERRFRLRRWLLAPVAATLLGVAFLGGAWMEHQRSAALAKTRERVLLMAMSDHLERSEALLTGLLHAPVGSIEVAEERERARTLLDENRLLRQTAQHLGDRPRAALLDDLERTLLDLANAQADSSPEDWQLLRQRVEQDRLLPKMRLTSAAAREEGQAL